MRGSGVVSAMTRPRIARSSSSLLVEQVLAVEQDPAGVDPPGRAQKAEHRPHQDGLAGARLADDAQGLAGLEGDVDAVQHRDACRPRTLMGDVQIVHLEQRRHGAQLRFTGSR